MQALKVDEWYIGWGFCCNRSMPGLLRVLQSHCHLDLIPIVMLVIHTYISHVINTFHNRSNAHPSITRQQTYSKWPILLVPVHLCTYWFCLVYMADSHSPLHLQLLWHICLQSVVLSDILCLTCHVSLVHRYVQHCIFQVVAMHCTAYLFCVKYIVPATFTPLFVAWLTSMLVKPHPILKYQCPSRDTLLFSHRASALRWHDCPIHRIPNAVVC